MSFILSFDQGTTSSRSLVIDQQGKVLAISQKEFHQSFPSPGLVEHNAEEIWHTQYQTAIDALKKAKLSPSDICAIGISNQRETTVVWEKKSGKPICPAIVWQDRRTATYCALLRSDGLEELFREKTGLILDPYFSAPKLVWILENVGGAKEKAQKGELAFGTIDSWLVWNLTKGKTHITDITNASRTLLLNIKTGLWDEEILDLLEIPLSLLPKIVSNSEIYGETDPSLFSPSIPIAGMAGDQQAALFGQSCFSKGDCKCTYGTGSFILMHTGNKPISSKHRLLSTVALKINEQIDYALEGSVFVSGAAVSWLRDNLGMIKSTDEVENLAKSVDDTHGVYFVPAFTGLGAPHWDPYARGLIIGLSRGVHKGHIARALLEGIAHQIREVIEMMQRDGEITLPNLKVDGGASSNNLLLQIQANFLGLSIKRPICREVAALGAGFLAGLAVGFWENKQQIAALWKIEKEFHQKISLEELDKRKREWGKAIHLAKEWESK